MSILNRIVLTAAALTQIAVAGGALFPPTLTKSFNPSAIAVGGTTTITLVLANPNSGITLTNLSFTDTLPLATFQFVSFVGINTCDLASYSPAAGLLTVTQASLAPSASCTVSLAIRGLVAGNFTNTTSGATSTQGTGLPASAALVVLDNIGVYQLKYFANLPFVDSAVNITNAGTFNGIDPDGRICANVYVFDADEELVSCCACPITPNGLVALSGRSDLIIKPLTPATPPSITVKLLFTVPTPIGSSTCNAASPTAATLVRGGLAWGITAHQVGTTIIPPAPPAAAGPFGLTETPFSPAELSLSELNKLVTFCRFIQLNGSSFGICNSCRQSTALGAEQK